MRKFAYWLAGAVAVVGLAMASAGATAASASTAGRAPVSHIVASNVGSHYSSAFAGYSLDGNGADVEDGIWRQLTLPNPGPSVPNDTLVDGIILGRNLSTGVLAVGEGAVWDDPSGCGTTGVWTLEDGVGPITLASQPVLPASELHPIISFGTDICIVGSGSEFVYLYDSHGKHVVRFSAGPNSNDWNVLDSAFVPGGTVFRTGGAGISACSTGQQFCPAGDNAAADITDGTSFDGGGVGFFLQGHGNSAFGQGLNMTFANYDNWEGTQDGNPPTPTNVVVLNTNPAMALTGPFGLYSENVPG